VRVYVPSTLPLLAEALSAKSVGLATAVEVDDDIRLAEPEGDDEAHEYLAFLRAVDASARLVSGLDLPLRRRVVIALDVAALTADAPWKSVAAVHVDEAPVDFSQREIDDDLLWFAPAEVAELLASEPVPSPPHNPEEN